MKSKQLANVLIKILGLSVCIHAIPTCVSGIVLALTTMGVTKTDIFMRVFSYAAGAAVEAVVGIVFIAMSQKIAGMMFKTDDE